MTVLVKVIVSGVRSSHPLSGVVAISSFNTAHQTHLLVKHLRGTIAIMCTKKGSRSKLISFISNRTIATSFCEATRHAARCVYAIKHLLHKSSIRTPHAKPTYPFYEMNPVLVPCSLNTLALRPASQNRSTASLMSCAVTRLLSEPLHRERMAAGARSWMA